MIAIPDFAAGTMENYGLVTYRETTLLFDDKHSTTAKKQRVGTVVAHELVHLWFGNLVTMEWWTHLWLNEGFAIWVSYLATDSLFPEWKIWTQFLEEATEGLRLDGLAESHLTEVWSNFKSGSCIVLNARCNLCFFSNYGSRWCFFPLDSRFGTVKSFFDAILALTEQPPKFDFNDPKTPFYTSARFLPPTKVDKCRVCMW